MSFNIRSDVHEKPTWIEVLPAESKPISFRIYIDLKANIDIVFMIVCVILVLTL
jgi:hypothetical protein